MTRSEIGNFLLKGKMKFRSIEGKRHIKYLVVFEGDVVGLPTILCHSRGSGDLTNREVYSIGKSLGLRKNRLQKAVECTIGRACVLVCLASRLLDYVLVDPGSYQPENVRVSLNLLLDEVEKSIPEESKNVWNQRENEALNDCRRAIELVLDNKILGESARRMLEIVER